ncbi:MAG: cell division protein FtsQ/DivIB [bacterium]
MMNRTITIEDKNRIAIDGVVLRDRYKFIRTFRVLFFLFITMLVMSLITSKIISFTGLIHIRKIEVSSDIKGIERKILDISGLKEDMPLTPSSLKLTEEKLRESRYFKDPSVYADIKGRVRIDLLVREPIGITIIDKKVYQVDCEGFILPVKPIFNRSYLPLIKYKDNQLDMEENRFKNFDVGMFLKKIPLSYMGKIEYIDISENRVHTFDGIDIITGGGFDTLKILRLEYIYPWLVIMGFDRVDIRFDNKFIVHKRKVGGNDVGS